MFLCSLFVSVNKINASETPKVNAYLTNIRTGEVKKLAVKETKIPNKSKSSSNSKQKVEFEVFAPIISPSPRDSGGGSKTEGGVTTTVSATYDTNASGKIKVSQFSGSWKPSSSMYTVGNRQAGVHSGQPYGHSMTKAVSSNSYSYNTGWGYNVYVGGDSSPRVWNSAIISVTGMTSTYKLELEKTFPN